MILHYRCPAGEADFEVGDDRLDDLLALCDRAFLPPLNPEDMVRFTRIQAEDAKRRKGK